MLQEYNIAAIVPITQRQQSLYVARFEHTEDPDITWPHRHAFYSIVWFTSGNGLYVVDFEEYQIQPNRIFLMSPKQIHNWTFSKNSKGYIVLIDQIFSPIFQDDFSTSYIDIHDKKTIRLFIDLHENLIDQCSRKDLLSQKILMAGIQYYSSAIQQIIFDSSQPPRKADSQIVSYKKLILSDTSKIKALSYYADKLKITTSELNKRCKQVTGLTAKQYLLDLKITEAKRLFIYTDQNINQISFEIGFEDPSYFTRIFKKKVGMTSQLFIKKYRL
ncbi:AraC family transcriptional regulator [Flavobacterium sp. HSC-61S13]|uniref:AraC family transcriptional regulator n=1 Tax=Flavobacterium sp. HSC-61S13 TaxID=2910963 RepID=UPI00209C9E87|nr:AraC family transcriptional regulator [Flavobacterium sp. HSC-61S13]MCP1996253.1 AraC-like DNA-binding protein [Flavobacterium sp. HSC-61S13]